jgi:hypothetical protein
VSRWWVDGSAAGGGCFSTRVIEIDGNKGKPFIFSLSEGLHNNLQLEQARDTLFSILRMRPPPRGCEGGRFTAHPAVPRFPFTCAAVLLPLFLFPFDHNNFP